MVTVVLPPLQAIAPAVAVAVTAAGAVTTTETVAEHPFISLTV
jgi:hypothetical protein